MNVSSKTLYNTQFPLEYKISKRNTHKKHSHNEQLHYKETIHFKDA